MSDIFDMNVFKDFSHVFVSLHPFFTLLSCHKLLAHLSQVLINIEMTHNYGMRCTPFLYLQPIIELDYSSIFHLCNLNYPNDRWSR